MFEVIYEQPQKTGGYRQKIGEIQKQVQREILAREDREEYT